MKEDRRKFVRSLVIPSLFILIVIAIKLIEVVFDLNFITFGIYPRELFGMLGIFTAPLIHSDFNHIVSNIFALLILGTSIEYFYCESSKPTLVGSYFLTGILVWVFARSSFHIGASGIVYSLASFLFFSGILKRDKRSFTLSLLVIFLYSGLVVGLFPIKEGISWESHLIGGIVGLIMAILFRKRDKFKRYIWETEVTSEDIRNLEISYTEGYQGEKKQFN